MSLLLEALKRAALEKQSKQDASAEVTGSDPNIHRDPNPVAAPTTSDDDSESANSASQELEREIEAFSASSQLNADQAGEKVNDTLDHENDVPPATLAADELTDWDQMEDLPLDESTPGGDSLASAEAEQSHYDDDEFDNSEPEVANFDFEAESESDTNRPATNSRPLALEETEHALQEARIAQEALLKEQEEAEAIEAASLARQRDVQQQHTARENRKALDQLIASGKAVAQRTRRRAMFLYAMLVLTAFGAIVAYYFYLLANSSIAELQQPTSSQPVIDVAEILEASSLEGMSTEQTAGGAVVSSTDGATDSSTDSTVSGTTDNSAGGAAAASIGQARDDGPMPGASNDTGSMAGTVGLASERNAKTTNASNLMPGTAALPQSAGTGSSINEGNLTIARRVDPAPSLDAYLGPLITSEREGVQRQYVAERVIVHHEKSSEGLNLLISNAYAALQRRDFEQAEQLYKEALEIVPTQRDALLGAAATATAMGRFNDAAGFYQQQIDADPKDSFARAGLLALMNDGRSRAAVQQEVATMLKANPRSAHLHFLKGIGFAAGKRWSLAQRAFYEAYNLDNRNPDYAFNLAVALDHLKQQALARIYYERALRLAEDRPANFDPSAVERRIEGLNP